MAEDISEPSIQAIISADRKRDGGELVMRAINTPARTIMDTMKRRINRLGIEQREGFGITGSIKIPGRRLFARSQEGIFLYFETDVTGQNLSNGTLSPGLHGALEFMDKQYRRDQNVRLAVLTLTRPHHQYPLVISTIHAAKEPPVIGIRTGDNRIRVENTGEDKWFVDSLIQPEIHHKKTMDTLALLQDVSSLTRLLEPTLDRGIMTYEINRLQQALQRNKNADKIVRKGLKDLIRQTKQGTRGMIRIA